jgi:hypothetical protein
MAKFKITPDNVEDKWRYVVKVANRMCYDSNKSTNKPTVRIETADDEDSTSQ